jgi:hypothetical protein
MVKFAPGRPVETREPVVDVDPGLPEGKHRFELVVEDDEGNLSSPSVAVVVVVGGGRIGGATPVGPEPDPPVGPIGPIGRDEPPRPGRVVDGGRVR